MDLGYHDVLLCAANNWQHGDHPYNTRKVSFYCTVKHCPSQGLVGTV